MKTFAAALFVLIAHTLPAQQTSEQSIPWKTGQTVKLDLKFAKTITLKGWNKNELYFKAQYTVNDGQLDSAHFIHKIADNNSIGFEAGLKEDLIKNRNNWYNCKDGRTISYNSGNAKNDNCQCICTDIHYTLYVPAGADLELETITGDVTITGMEAAIEVKSVTGSVEAIVNENHPADVALKTVTGRVASDPDMSTLTNEGLRPLLARKLTGKLNGGGKQVSLESVTGNVWLKNSGGQ